MIPSILFDKSFLQSISTDSSVWFDHFFMPVVCPLFYVETLADLKKESSSRPPEIEVKIIAEKFPESNGAPCIHHTQLCLGNLLGQTIPMDGRIPSPQGRLVKAAGKSGVVFDDSLEALAFARWAKQEFSELERDIASVWRQQLSSINLPFIRDGLKALGINRTGCKTLEDAKNIAESIVNKNDNRFSRMKFALEVLQIPEEFHSRILENWKIYGYKSLHEYAPYAAYVLTVKIFFTIALATDFISADRASNWADICYLYYLPFCSLFTSSDKLHKLCTPLFLRPNQHFIWGSDFRDDLTKINAHYKDLPTEIIEQGISSFAKSLPGNLELKVQSAWDICRHSSPINSNKTERQQQTPRRADIVLLNEINSIKNAPALKVTEVDFDPMDPDVLSIERRIHPKKGSWYQVPKNLA